MNAINYSLLFTSVLFASTVANAAGSMLRVTCDGENVGAEVLVNGKFRGECPVDLQVPAGSLKLLVRKDVDAQRERVFEQVVRMGEDSVKKIEAVLSVPRLTAAGQKLEDQRLAAVRAETARNRAQFDTDLASGAIQAAFRDCPDCPEMAAIPPGSFEMGSIVAASNEQPMHSVSIAKAFAIGKTEITQGQWKAVMGNNPSHFKDCGDNCPVEQVSWNDIQTFIQKLNAKTGKQYRLPSEAEWEYACRAGGQQEYCGSDNLDSVGWYGAHADPVGNSAKTTNPVATKQANAFGLYDMSGNVWEWVEDSYHNNYNRAPVDGSAWQGDGAERVLRGGSWGSVPQDARAAIRLGVGPADRYIVGGFRLTRMLP